MAERKRIPIIADEIYENLVFSGQTFHSLASLSVNVPVISSSGIAKEFMVPGWRVGWIVMHDRHGALRDVRPGLVKLSQHILGANSLVQSVIPHILTQVPKTYLEETAAQIEVWRLTRAN